MEPSVILGTIFVFGVVALPILGLTYVIFRVPHPECPPRHRLNAWWGKVAGLGVLPVLVFQKHLFARWVTKLLEWGNFGDGSGNTLISDLPYGVLAFGTVLGSSLYLGIHSKRLTWLCWAFTFLITATLSVTLALLFFTPAFRFPGSMFVMGCSLGVLLVRGLLTERFQEGF